MAGSRWVRLDADYFRNPKALTAGADGRALHLASICWSGLNDNLDGFIPTSAVRALLADAEVSRRTVDRVLAAGLWVPDAGGYQLHDWRELNGSDSEAEVQRIKWRQRQADYRARRKADALAETNGETRR